jgi:hypothetical protein
MDLAGAALEPCLGKILRFAQDEVARQVKWWP